MSEFGLIALIGAICGFGILLCMVRLPGTWLIVACATGYSWWLDWPSEFVFVTVLLLILAVAGEVSDLVMSFVSARKGGASKRAAWGGLIGGILGGLLLTLVPIPIINTVVGALVGCFAGAMLGELTANRGLSQSTRAGFFSALGMVLATVAKLAIAMVMTAILITMAIVQEPDQPGIAASSEQTSLTDRQ